MLGLGLLYLLFLSGGVSSERSCVDHDVLDHLNLTKNKELYTLTRPVSNHTHPTVVKLEAILFAILAVTEKSQTFIPFIWIVMKWNNELISWDPSEYCGISQISVPANMIWKPDIIIHEMTDKGKKDLLAPYVYLTHNGTVILETSLEVVSTCKMDVHQFPFDTQSCNITFASQILNEKHLQIKPMSNSSRNTERSDKAIKTEGEWEFMNITVGKGDAVFDGWDQIIYTITMRRRPLLYVTNFMLPILFFLVLDLSSFFISDEGGEKLGFKVTMLLALSVMMLILKDILPSVSNKTPLIATYCVGTFAFMLLSLLETILVTYLIKKDSTYLETDADRDHTPMDDCEKKRDNSHDHTCDTEGKQTCCACICDAGGRDASSELLPMVEETGVGVKTGESRLLLLILEEVKEVERMLSLFANGRKEGKPGYWTKVARRINIAYFIFYLISSFLFLVLLCVAWMN